jgi:hypothetical protein
MKLSYKVLRVEPSGKIELDYISKDDLFTKYKVYAPFIKDYENISFVIPEYKTKYNDIANIKMNTFFKDYSNFKGINYILLDYTQEPEDLNKEYKKLINDIKEI